MDIGGKFCMIKYLNNNNIFYDYVLFLQSKSDINGRKKYFKPLISNLEEIMENISEYDGYFPDIQWEINSFYKRTSLTGNPQYDQSNSIEYNSVYRTDLLNYLKSKYGRYNGINNTNKFIEGNVYLLKRDVINKIFTDNLLYNILNTETSFDYNWTKLTYKLQSGIENAYNVQRMRPGRINYERDGLMEHTFERVILNLCGNYKLLEEKKKEVIFITGNMAGGSYKWFKDMKIILGEKNFNFTSIKIKKDLQDFFKNYNKNFKKEQIYILINSFLLTDITISDIIELYYLHKFKIILPIHDFYWLTNNRDIITNTIHNIYLSSLVFGLKKKTII